MAQGLNSDKVTHLASELAAATGQDLESAVVSALEEKLARIGHSQPPQRENDIDDLFQRLAEMPVLDGRSADEIIGYEDGLPK